MGGIKLVATYTPLIISFALSLLPLLSSTYINYFLSVRYTQHLYQQEQQGQEQQTTYEQDPVSQEQHDQDAAAATEGDPVEQKYAHVLQQQQQQQQQEQEQPAQEEQKEQPAPPAQVTLMISWPEYARQKFRIGRKMHLFPFSIYLC